MVNKCPIKLSSIKPVIIEKVEEKRPTSITHHEVINNSSFLKTTAITLTSAAGDITSDALAVSISDALSVKAPSVNLSTLIVDTTGANNIIVPANADKQTWVYVKHTGTTDGSTTTTQHVDVELTGDVAVGTLKAGEFFWFPFCGNGGSTGVQLQSVSGNVQVEYAYWSDSTAQ